MVSKRLIWIAVLVLGVFLSGARTVHAQQPTPSDDEVNAIARQLFCPVCQNTPLDVCPTQACQQWRDLIRQMLADGKSADYIKQYFVVHYGARVLAEPPRTGFNWLIYIVPPAAFLLGLYLLFRAYQVWKRMPKESVGDAEGELPSAANDPYVARVEEELRKRR